jgi:putative oxidoreductase
MLTTFSKNVLVPLLLRLALAAIFIYHGLDKIGKDGGTSWHPGGPDAPPGAVQLAVAWGELLGGVALAVGFLTRLAAVGIIAIMAGAIVTVTWQNGFDNTKHGFEYNFAIIVMCVCLVLCGPGPIAVDRVFRFKRKES